MGGLMATNYEHYQAIAEAIRQAGHIEYGSKMKPPQMAQHIMDGFDFLYAAGRGEGVRTGWEEGYIDGQRSVLYASRHMNGTASGETIALNDVSSVEHGVSVKLSSDTITDFSEVIVKRYGANRFHINATDTITCSWSPNDVARQFQEGVWYIGLTSNNYWASGSVVYTLRQDAVIVMPTTNGYGIAQAFRCKPRQQYYFSCEKTSGATIMASFYDKNGNWLNKITDAVSNGGFTTPDACYWVTICFGGTRDVEHTFSEVQLSFSPIDAYEPYVEPTTYTANADGTVYGVRSLSPSMTLTTDTDGVTIDCSYLRDIDRYIDGLTGGD